MSLDASELEKLRAAFDAATFVDGRETAGWAARTVKQNQQARAGDPAMDAMRTLVAERLQANPLFQMAARPKALTPILLAHYEPGMTYGTHVDDALMHGLRTDLSWTLWLDEPESYDGGELVIESPSGEAPIKGPAGAVHLYPSTTLHRVDPVRSGIRRVAVGWVQSRVREGERREILFDLDSARRALFEQSGKTGAFDLLSKSFANLLRMWADA
ncbi:MAG: Fe2+-dependent dioxygenase [Phyllobacteriaceae bacterium]|nr:Fe2+-dependent dioxygenase [Phyllobacteriaceae bacterium]